ncbi:hypothetical protein E2986_07281 [Frieseomelitta varia]|uniref:Uncharacterized protein n=1 Tax=Frieseomelitta varia TaxID=561572 RepID=A0A833S5N7_9HYME|nr:hypothetical protein E2986_07281 [Frieseomelitta varia]
MYHCYLKLLQQKVSHYISWNILFLWGFGLWIALCTSNVYHSIIAKQQDFEVLHDISTEAKTIEEMLDVTRTNHTFCNVIIMLKTVLQKDSAMLEYKLIPNSTTSTKYVQTELSCNDEDKWDLMMNRNKNTLDMNVIQSEIIFTSRTLLLFNNCELYRYFNNHRLKNHLLTKYFARQDPVHVENNLEISNEYERNDRILPKKVIKRGIISSSPEFKKFLANLTKSELFYPCMLEVSASYMIRIKSTCKSSRSND